MSKVIVNDSSLTAIGNAIRSKTGKSDLLSLSDMPTAIEGIKSGSGGSLDVKLEGDCSYLFCNSQIRSQIPNIATLGFNPNNPVTNASSIFKGCNQIPNLFNDENLELVLDCNWDYAFSECDGIAIKLKKLTLKDANFDQIFADVKNSNINIDELNINNAKSARYIFVNTSSNVSNNINAKNIYINFDNVSSNAPLSYIFGNAHGFSGEIENFELSFSNQNVYGLNLGTTFFPFTKVTKVNNIKVSWSGNGNYQYIGNNSLGLVSGCTELSEIGSIVMESNYSKTTQYPYRFQIPQVIYNCNKLVKIGEILGNELNYNGLTGMFQNCTSLRNFKFRSSSDARYFSNYTNLAYTCTCIDSLEDIFVSSNTHTSNVFGNTCGLCFKIKKVTFEKNTDGTPKNANWKNQTIDFSNYLGWIPNSSYANNLRNYLANSATNVNKAIYNAETYALYKDDDDAYAYNSGNQSTSYIYSRYNHDSAVETIDSLPDTSAYLTTAGGTNTIKFKGAAGSATEGGAINTMTAEEIAVATVKGWTVTFV